MPYVTAAFTVVPAIAVAGAVIVVVTSASGETAVVAVAESGSVLAPWLVVVPIVLLAVTAPDGGAVNDTPIDSDWLGLSVVGNPPSATWPVAGLYVAVAPGGKPLNVTLARPGGKPMPKLTPAAGDGPVLEKTTVPLTVIAAVADAGNVNVVATSATAEIAVTVVPASGAVLAP